MIPPFHIRRVPTAVFLVAALLWLAHASLGGAQVAEGTLAGVVVDPEGKALAGASIMVRGVTTSLRRTTTTRADGAFSFPSLPAGEWKAEASLDGYTVALVGEIQVHVAQTRRLRLTLEPSEFQEMVTQSDYRPLARTGPELGAWVTPSEMSSLPLRTRTVADLVALVPLASATPPQIRLDGGRTAPQAPMVAAVEEAALLSHSYGAEHGGADTGVVSLVTRSGGAAERSVFGFVTDDSPQASDTDRTQLGATYGVSPRKNLHLFGAWERHDGAEDDTAGNRDWLTAQATWHDAMHVARVRYLLFQGDGSDPDGSFEDEFGAGSSRTGRSDSLLAGLQSQPLDGVVNDLRVQWTSDREILQIRDDLFVAGPENGRHELAFGAESLTAGADSLWSLFARDRWLGHDRLTVTAALRSQHADLGGCTEESLLPRLAVVWSLDADGSHLLRGAAGRYRSSELGSRRADQLSLGWSWQMSPFLGLNFDAVSVAFDQEADTTRDPPLADYEAVGFTVRSRISDVFQVRASMSWTDAPDAVPGADEDRERAVLTGIVHAPGEILLAAVYRHGRSPVLGRSDGARGISQNGFDLRLSKLLPLGDDASVEIMAEVFDVFEEADVEGDGERIGQLGLRVRF